jgi:hypothetical protein
MTPQQNNELSVDQGSSTQTPTMPTHTLAIWLDNEVLYFQWCWTMHAAQTHTATASVQKHDQ